MNAKSRVVYFLICREGAEVPMAIQAEIMADELIDWLEGSRRRLGDASEIGRPPSSY